MCAGPLFPLLSALLITAGTGLAGDSDVSVEGAMRVWHPLELTFQGPTASATDDRPNPFLDYRLQVEFTNQHGNRVEVPGFFDGDGKGGERGTCWRVRFTPNTSGQWKYRASFRTGAGVAVDLAAGAGEPCGFDGTSGSLSIASRDPAAPGFLKWGRLLYAGGHYLKFQDGPYWIKGGTDSPENLLAYSGFDNTPPSHHFAGHVEDWRTGDPDWGGGKGRGLIGALNYLASRHVNSIYFLTMNIGGDGKDVWPWTGKPDRKGSPANDNLHYDPGKLRQWNLVFDHAQRVGIALHCVFNEAEAANKRELDDGELGPERKLYYRELVARFGHHLAVEWNLCEEYNLEFDLGPERIRAFADYVRAVDPYDHPISVHSAGDPVEKLRFTFGDERFGLTSIQLNQRPIQEVTKSIRSATRAAGRPMPVSLDEFTVDRGQKASHIPVDDADGHRKEKIWPAYLSGGQLEFILQDMLNTESFKTDQRERLWQALWYARKFMEEHLPFWELEPIESGIRGAGTIATGIGRGRTHRLGPQVFARRGEVYAIYLPTARPSGSIDLSECSGPVAMQWYNPRTGQFAGQIRQAAAAADWALGDPPSDPGEDWVALIRRVDGSSSHRGHFPGRHWEMRSPEAVGLDPGQVDAFVERMKGDGCLVRDGYMVRSWGHFDTPGDWASAAKPVLSTLLLLAVQEGRIPSVDALVRNSGWDLTGKDASITYRHLANMVSGYGRAEAPGKAWAYNDHAIQLYALALQKAFGHPLDQVFRDRLSHLAFEDGPFFKSRHGLGVSASPRDFARLGWLWLNEGEWDGARILPRALLQECFRPGVPAGLRGSLAAGAASLNLGTYGGGTNQTPHGPGVYGFNFWFNARRADGSLVWPDLPADTYQANGMWNRDTVTVIPAWRMVVAVRGASHGEFAPPDPRNDVIQNFRLLTPGTPRPHP